MKKSEFQFTSPAVTALEFLVNEAFDVEKNSKVGISTSFSRSIHQAENAPEALVEITIEVGTKGEKAPFFLSITIGAHFKWEEGVYTDEEIQGLLSQNAVSLLIAYARPIIASITNASPFNAYNLPFINLTEADR